MEAGRNSGDLVVRIYYVCRVLTDLVRLVNFNDPYIVY